MKEQITIAANAVRARLFTKDKRVRAIVRDSLSYYVEGAEFARAFQSQGWNGYSTFFDGTDGTFPAGFVDLVYGALTSAGYTVRLARKRAPKPLGIEKPIVDNFGEDARYAYQREAVRLVERHGRGILHLATGAGKSRCVKFLVMRYRRPTLFLTTRSVLMHQMKDQLVDLGLNVGVLGEGEWYPVKGVNVGMVQTLVHRLRVLDPAVEARALNAENQKKKLGKSRKQIRKEAEERVVEQEKIRAKTIKLLQMFEVVIGEEAHEAGGNSYFQVLQECCNADVRVALTATPFMRENQEDNMRLMAAFGPILLQVSEETLIERGILATPYFKYVEYKPHPKLRKTSPWQRAYQLGIMESEWRNQAIVDHARKAVDHGLTVMILVQRTAHGDALRKVLEPFVRVAYLQGETSQSARQRALDRLRAGEIDVLIGTTILDVGVDVPAVGMVILAGGGKAEVGLRQRIGRGLRAKKNGANVCFVVDFADGTNDVLKRHYRQRREIVENTPGFAENIIPEGEDFPWHLISTQKTA